MNLVQTDYLLGSQVLPVNPDKQSKQLLLSSWLLMHSVQFEEMFQPRKHSVQSVERLKLGIKHVSQSVAGSAPGRTHTLQSESVNLSGCRQRVQLVAGSLLGKHLVQPELISHPGRQWVQLVEGSLLGKH